jgi:hypothetical protein
MSHFDCGHFDDFIPGLTGLCADCEGCDECCTCSWRCPDCGMDRTDCWCALDRKRENDE